MTDHRKGWAILAGLIGLLVIIAVIDTNTPLDTPVWTLNIVVIVLSVFTGRPWAPLFVGVLSTVALTLDYFLTFNFDSTRQINMISRSLGIATFWTVAVIVRQFIKSQNDLVTNQRITDETNQKLDDDATVKAALVGINDSMRGVQNVEELCQRFLERVAIHIDAAVGSFYLADEEHTSLRRIARYAYTDTEGFSRSFAFNEGLIGEAASQLKLLELNGVSDDYFIKIKSSFGEMTPKHLIALPISFEGKLNGVMELGSIEPFSGVSRKILELIPENIGIAVDLASSRVRLRKLLLDSQRYSDELKTQQEELRTLNEELSEKTNLIEQAYSKLETQQANLEEANSELEHKQQELEERKEALEEANTVLKKSTREIELASRYKSEFLSNMSHELRTPLNSILILSELLAQNNQDNFSNDDIESLETITSSGKDLLTLINDILDLSRIEAGKVELHAESISLEAFVHQFEPSIGPQAEAKGLTLAISCTVDDDTIYTDRQRLEQIIKNFLSNAIKFTESGQVRLEVSEAGPDTLPIAITVEDSGIGIPNDKQDAIFEAFRQADGSTARQFGGTGLGLSISRELATLLGGRIEMDSKVGKGSRFTLLIPRNIQGPMVQHIDSESQSSSRSGYRNRPARKSPEESNTLTIKRDRSKDFKDDRNNLRPGDKVLQIIEDEPKFAQIVSKLARQQHFKCILSEDGEAGLVDANHYLPSGIFLDVNLPGMSGMEVLEQLKADPKTKHIPIHVASGLDRKKNALHLGALSFLNKPVGVDKLNEALFRIEDINLRKLKRILIVEDNQTQLNNLLRIISDLGGVDTVGVKTGHEAFTHLSSETFDCVILDLTLPDMTGIELLQKMASNETLANPPVIIYTAKELSSEEENKLREYSDSIIIKNVHSPERLLDDTLLFLHKVEDQLPAPKRKVLKVMRERDHILEGAKILLVDDDMRNVFSLRKVLTDKDADVTVARNGQEALACLEKQTQFDIVLMDIMMPIMDGYEAMTKIREKREFKDLPIVALTAKAMKGDREKCIEAGANDYLPKPVDIKRLLSLVRVWLSPKGF